MFLFRFFKFFSKFTFLIFRKSLFLSPSRRVLLHSTVSLRWLVESPTCRILSSHWSLQRLLRSSATIHNNTPTHPQNQTAVEPFHDPPVYISERRKKNKINKNPNITYRNFLKKHAMNKLWPPRAPPPYLKFIRNHSVFLKSSCRSKSPPLFFYHEVLWNDQPVHKTHIS